MAGAGGSGSDGDQQGQQGAGGAGSEQVAGSSGQGGQGGDQQTAGTGAGGDGDQQGAGGADGQGAGADGSGDVFGGSAQAGAGSGDSEEFDRSLGDFDAIMGAEQEAIARAGVGTAADEVFREAGGLTGAAGVPGGERQGSPTETGGQVGSSQGGGQQTGAGPTRFGTPPPPDDPEPIEGCEDEDKVARQLCEAATEEKDPFLRAALWDEYNEYKKIVARQ